MKLKNCVRSALENDDLNIIYLGLDRHIYDLWNAYPKLNIYLAAHIEGANTNYDPNLVYDLILVDNEHFTQQSLQALRSEGVPVIFLATTFPSKKTVGYITKYRYHHIHEVLATNEQVANAWFTDKLININNLEESYQCLKKLLPVARSAYFQKSPEIPRLDAQQAS